MNIDGCLVYNFTPNELKKKLNSFLKDKYGIDADLVIHFDSQSIYPVKAEFSIKYVPKNLKTNWEQFVEDLYRASQWENDELGHDLLRLYFFHPVKKYLFSLHDDVQEYIYEDEDCVYVIIDQKEKLLLVNDDKVRELVVDWKNNNE